MRIAVLGGIDRHEDDLRRLAEGAGHELDFCTGHEKARRVALMVTRCDLLLVCIGIVSHGAVAAAKRAAALTKCRVVYSRTSGPSRFSQLLGELR